MGNQLSSHNSHRITAQDRAILDLKLQRDKLRQYQKKISAVLQREREIAKECLARGDRARALLALRRRKYQESLLAKTDQQLETLEQLTSSIEFALVEKDVLYGLRQGNKVLKQIQAEMSLDSVEKLMDETADAILYQRQVSDMLSGTMTNADEDEVEDELEAMEREVTGKVTGKVDISNKVSNISNKVSNNNNVAAAKATTNATETEAQAEAQAQRTSERPSAQSKEAEARRSEDARVDSLPDVPTSEPRVDEAQQAQERARRLKEKERARARAEARAEAAEVGDPSTPVLAS